MDSLWPTDLGGLQLSLHTARTRASLRNAARSWPERAHLLLRLRDKDGREGFGEAAPLAPFCHDELPQLQRALEALAAAMARGAAPDELEAQSGRLPDSARFALDCARWDLQAQREGLPAWRWLRRAVGGTEQADRLQCNAMLSCEPARWQPELDAAIEAGARTLKLKVGFREPSLLAQIAALRGLRCPPQVRLRLDANLTLSDDDATRMRTALADSPFEYLEDPVPAERLMRLPAAGLSLALDQLLLDDFATSCARTRQGGVSTWVCKPSQLGGLGALLRRVHHAEELGVELVCSHAFEGPVAYAATLHLALALSPAPAHGLWPHAVLTAWPELPAALLPAFGGLSAPHAPGLGFPSGWGAALAAHCTMHSYEHEPPHG